MEMEWLPLQHLILSILVRTGPQYNQDEASCYRTAGPDGELTLHVCMENSMK